MIEKYYASHIKDIIDASAINVRKIRHKKCQKMPKKQQRSWKITSFNLAKKYYPVIRLFKCGRGGIGRRNGLKRNKLSAPQETEDVELLKFGEPFQMAIPSQAWEIRKV